MNGSDSDGCRKREREAMPVSTMDIGHSEVKRAEKKRKKKKSGPALAMQPQKRKPGDLKRKEANIMEDIRAMVSSSKEKRRHSAPSHVEAPGKPLLVRQKVVGTADDPFGTIIRTSAARRTEEGYRILTEEEVGINQGGDTPDCPFECKCCF